jgi:hypothetical protein
MEEKKKIIQPPRLSANVAKPMMLKFGENILRLLNKNYFKFDTNPTVDLGGTTI